MRIHQRADGGESLKSDQGLHLHDHKHRHQKKVDGGRGFGERGGSFQRVVLVTLGPKVKEVEATRALQAGV
jgi:hypothetical protein